MDSHSSLHQPFHTEIETLEDRHPIDLQHRDACALICSVRKGGQPTHGNVKRTIEALARMGHRTGIVNGEGDGVGVLTDIPRELWSKWLGEAGLRSSLATDRHFWVAHIMIPAKDRTRMQPLIDQISREISQTGLHILLDREGKVNRRVLGPNAEKSEPGFWQIAGINGQIDSNKLDATLFDLQVQLETELDVHFASFSSHSVVYKVQGTIEILRRYYPELRDPDFASTITMGHARYSTNTNPIFERAQPFGVLGHNGEFNTISRFRMEAGMLGIPLNPDNSDSQDIDRVLQALCMYYDLDLIEAMEYIFPPFEHDLIQNMPELHQMYAEMRQAFGPFAQGPAGIAARLGDLCVFSIDALGLRPLWFGETEKEYFASSEQGVYPLDVMTISPKPIAPGEKIALRIKRGHSIEFMDYPAIQQHVYNQYQNRRTNLTNGRNIRQFGKMSSSYNAEPHSGKGNRPSQPVPQYETMPLAVHETSRGESHSSPRVSDLTSITAQQHSNVYVLIQEASVPKLNASSLAALGWERYHLELVETMAAQGKELIGSLGWDGPLAALSQTRVNIADYFKETIAVVTNPAIDRVREQAQFSSRVYIGSRPDIGQPTSSDSRLITLDNPLLLGVIPGLENRNLMESLAIETQTQTIERITQHFEGRLAILTMCAADDEGIDIALKRLQQSALDAARDGVECLILDDWNVLDGSSLWIDPLLATAAIDKALRQAEDQPNLRRKVGVVIRSGSLRDLHDIALCISFGAHAVMPYALYAIALGIAPKGGKEQPEDAEVIQRLGNTVHALKNGLQKITSTIGCHELRGYGHSFSSIGLSKNVAHMLGTPNYFGSEARGLTWTSMKDDSEERAEEFRGEKRARLNNPDRFYPKMWKRIEAMIQGTISPNEYSETLLNLEKKIPVSIRHVLQFKESNNPTDPEQVDLRIKDHDMPMLISAMSFGSQGELAYRAYAEAAHKLNIVCMNGEGGEIADLIGKYPRNRGQQVASGRFGVNIELLNSCNLIEIKIGQGAKPGEGGHLPGYKVTGQIAAVRHTLPGVDLISPSNNHDLYSIEDLAQLIDELKTANPNARVSVKIPVVPGVGIIAVGVAKAGADIITITGYTGGTGAARAHALRHVGLPAEIGVWLSHRTLIESELRDEVEIWVDGGMKSGRDVVKMICLGANRVGFGTLPMVAVGCTICRGCQDGTCHVGITTHVKTTEEAEKKGFKSFRPFEDKGSADGIVTAFHMLAVDIKKWTALLGATRTQDLVGHAEKLDQIALHDRIDLTPLLRPIPRRAKKSAQPGGRRISRPRNTVSKQITDVVSEYIRHGDYELTYDDEQVLAMDRALGTHLIGAIKRRDVPDTDKIEAINLSFSNSAIPGNGLGAFLDDPVNILVEGGAQDGVGKSAKGGTIAVLKGLNHNGARLDGSVGKSFAYGAQGGLFIVQGDADTRACIRMSGADVVFGGEVTEPIRDELGGIGARANLKGYAFEYMTSGRVLVLGDPGPWICAGMSGGVVYQRIQPEMGLTEESIQRRIATGAMVEIQYLDEQATQDIRELLLAYIRTLEDNHQAKAAQHLYTLLKSPLDHFVKIAPPPRIH